MKILAIDVGNTSTEFGVISGGEIECSFSYITKEKRTSDESASFVIQMLSLNGIDRAEISDGIISSVVPDVNQSLINAIVKYFGFAPLVVGPGIKTIISIVCDDPREVGADRIVDAVAAYCIYGGPVIIASYGTANRFDYVNEKGEFCAAITAPGIQISADALQENAAKLPQIEIAKPESILAKNTVTSMQAGLVYSQIGASEYIIAAIREATGTNAKAIACGGYANAIYEYTSCIDVYDPHLTLKGLNILYERNRKQ